jgi:hypothetical protein
MRTVTWFERRRKQKLLGLKRIVINGMRFTIRRVNPMMDFPLDKVPQLFTEFQTSRKPDPTKPPTVEQVQAMRDMMFAYIEAGVVEPRLSPVGVGDKNGQEDGITAEDLCRDQDMGIRLYWEILSHSLNTFRGVKSLFFSIKQKFLLSMLLRLGSGLSRWMSSRPPIPQPPTSGNFSTFSSPASPSRKNSDRLTRSGAMLNAGGANG